MNLSIPKKSKDLIGHFKFINDFKNYMISEQQTDNKIILCIGPSGIGKTTLLKIITYAPIGLIMLVYGSDLFIDGASQIALLFGISSYVIGLTLTALGTSLPELSACIQSAR